MRSRLRQMLKWIGIVFGGVLLVLTLAFGIMLFVFDWNWFKETIIAQASEATGRKIQIDGNLQGEFSLVPRIRIERIRIANADWAKDPEMASIGIISLQIRLLDLLRGRIVLPDLVIENAKILLEKNERGDPNWKFGPSVAGAVAEATIPDDRNEFPIVEQLSLKNTSLIYRDPTQKLNIVAGMADVKGGGGGDTDTRLSGEGNFQDSPFKFDLVAGPLLRLRETKEPYPLNANIIIGDMAITAKGTIADPIKLTAMDIRFSIAGDNLANIYPIFRVPLPPSPKYRLGGDLHKDGNKIAIGNLSGRIGNSDIEGKVEVDIEGKRPLLQAAVTSTKLDFKDLGAFIGVPPEDQKNSPDSPNKQAVRYQQPPGRVLPHLPINLERLRAMDMRVSFEGREILAPNLPLENLKTKISLDNGFLKIDPISVGLAGGTVSGILILDGREAVPAVDMDMVLRNLGLQPFFKKTKMADMTSGQIGGKIKLSGQGQSTADILATSNGRITMGMVGGSLDPLIVELMGLDVGQALLVLLTPTAPIQIRCALGDLNISSGIAKINGLVFDTTDSNIWAQGAINFQNEGLDIHLNADPKDVSLLSANAPVAVTGTFASPKIAVDPLKTSGKGGLKEKLGAIVNPILALLPFVDLGLGQDTDCQHFEQNSQKPVPAGTKGAKTPQTPQQNENLPSQKR